MNEGFEKLLQAQALMAKALQMARGAGSQNNQVLEARSHMKSALDKLSHVTRKTQLRKSQPQTPNSAVAKVAETAKQPQAPLTVEAFTRSMAEIDRMINGEREKLKQLESEVENNSKDQELLND